jgi:purine-binding chemotaxis protein CheW
MSDFEASPENEKLETRVSRTREILRERARILAREFVVEKVEEVVDLVELQYAGRRYAIETDLVREVVAVPEVTPLPCTPEFVLGLLNIRGKIVSVVDLCRVLGLGETHEPWARVIIVETHQIEVAFGIGSCQVTRMPQSRLRGDAAEGGHSHFVKTLTTDGVALLDIERIIAETRYAAQNLLLETEGQ